MEIGQPEQKLLHGNLVFTDDNNDDNNRTITLYDRKNFLRLYNNV